MNKDIEEYLNFNLLERNIFDFYSRHKVEFPKADAYRNFTLFLNNKIQKTYVGDDFMTNKDRERHFKWAWDQVCMEFQEIGFNFSLNDELFRYMSNLFFDLFYDVEDKEDKFNQDFFRNISIVVEGIFNYSVLKNKESLSIFLDIYNIFNKKI